MSTNSASLTMPVDWDALNEEIHCPLCEYNLRGLINPRCPECGYQFEWPELLDPTRRLHRYLFEHHPERNIHSYLRTILGGWRPRRFWKSLQPIQPSRPRRLILYYLVTVCLIVLPTVVIGLTVATLHIRQPNMKYRASELSELKSGQSYDDPKEIIELYGSIQAYLDFYHPINPATILLRIVRKPKESMAYLLPLGLLIAYPWLSYLSLMIFRISMRRARIRSIHVLRCAIYTSDILMGSSLAVAICVSIKMWTSNILAMWFFDNFVSDILFWSLIVTLPFVWYRLTVAYRYYLRFDHPFLTVLAAQFITLLLLFNIALLPVLWL